MEGKKLIITPKTKTDTTTILSARVPTDMLKKIDLLAKSSNRNRNEVVQLLLEFALENTVVLENKDGE